MVAREVGKVSIDRYSRAYHREKGERAVDRSYILLVPGSSYLDPGPALGISLSIMPSTIAISWPESSGKIAKEPKRGAQV
jgi:hypothetical protein